MKKFSLILSAMLILLFTQFQVQAYAIPILVGDTVEASVTPSSSWRINPASATVIDPGVEFTLEYVPNSYFHFDVDIGPSYILMAFMASGTIGGNVGSALTISDIDWVGYPGVGIGDFSFSTAGTLRIDASDVTFTADTLTLFFDGSFREESWVRVDLEPDASPVPEPSTMLLVGFGLIGLVGFRKRFRKR